MMFLLNLFKKKRHKYLDKTDYISLFKTIQFFKIFFKDKDIIKDNMLDIEITVIESNILKYIKHSKDIILGDLDLINILIYSDNFNTILLKEFITIDDYILLDNNMYINELLLNLEHALEIQNNTSDINDSKKLYRYIIHMLDIYKCIYDSYTK